MRDAVMRTQRDGHERGMIIAQNKHRVERTRIQKGVATEVVVKLEMLDIKEDDDLISFHSHTGFDPTPSLRDLETAVVLGEAYTCIGYTDFKNHPHIAVWRIRRHGESAAAKKVATL